MTATTPARSLDGLVSIVTGGAAGIGRAVAGELARAGSAIAVLDRDEPGAERAATEFAALGVAAKAYRADVTSSSAVDAAFDAVAADFGSLDVVVNNAGISLVGPRIVDTTDEAWDQAIAVMQTGVFYCMRAAGRHLLPARSGAVVNISSIRGYSPNPGRIAYCAAKAAVLMMTKIAAGEWAPYGVRVNAIAPGVQRTPMWDEDVRLGVCDEERVLRTTPAGRLGEPWEVGRLAAYLASPDAAFVNGACVSIDGGLTSIAPDSDEIVRPG